MNADRKLIPTDLKSRIKALLDDHQKTRGKKDAKSPWPCICYGGPGSGKTSAWQALCDYGNEQQKAAQRQADRERDDQEEKPKPKRNGVPAAKRYKRAKLIGESAVESLPRLVRDYDDALVSEDVGEVGVEISLGQWRRRILWRPLLVIDDVGEPINLDEDRYLRWRKYRAKATKRNDLAKAKMPLHLESAVEIENRVLEFCLEKRAGCPLVFISRMSPSQLEISGRYSEDLVKRLTAGTWISCEPMPTWDEWAKSQGRELATAAADF